MLIKLYLADRETTLVYLTETKLFCGWPKTKIHNFGFSTYGPFPQEKCTYIQNYQILHLVLGSLGLPKLKPAYGSLVSWVLKTPGLQVLS